MGENINSNEENVNQSKKDIDRTDVDDKRVSSALEERETETTTENKTAERGKDPAEKLANTSKEVDSEEIKESNEDKNKQSISTGIPSKLEEAGESKETEKNASEPLQNTEEKKDEDDEMTDIRPETNERTDDKSREENSSDEKNDLEGNLLSSETEKKTDNNSQDKKAEMNQSNENADDVVMNDITKNANQTLKEEKTTAANEDDGNSSEKSAQEDNKANQQSSEENEDKDLEYKSSEKSEEGDEARAETIENSQNDANSSSRVRKSRRLTQQQTPTNARSLRPRISARISSRTQAQEEKQNEKDDVDAAEEEKEEEEEIAPAPEPQPAEEPPKEKEEEEVEKQQSEPEKADKPKFSKKMRVRDICFVTEDLLEEPKRKRLMERKVKPIEYCTYADLRKYNRDQLRAYCFAYGSMRKKKTEMEAEMVRYLSLWNDNKPGFRVEDYVPANQRIVIAPEVDSADVHIEIFENLAEREAAVKGLHTGRISANKTSRSSAHGKNAGQKSSTTSTPRNDSQTPNITASGSNPIDGKLVGKTSNSRVRTSGMRGHSSTGQKTPGRTGSRTSSGARGTPSQGAGTPPNPAIGNLNVDGKNSTVGDSSSKTGKNGAQPGTSQQKGNGMSFKQKVHAKQAGAKYKAAYNGAGPAIVNIVENAAAYFDGKDNPEVILDQSKSYARYQFNVDMLTEIFDGPIDRNVDDNDVEMQEANGKDNEPQVDEGINSKPNLLRELGRNMLTDRASKEAAELQVMEARFQKIQEETKQTERRNMRLFQRLERAETREEVLQVKRAFEEQQNMKFQDEPQRIVRRKIDKSLPPIDMSDEKCRVLRFKVT